MKKNILFFAWLISIFLLAYASPRWNDDSEMNKYILKEIYQQFPVLRILVSLYTMSFVIFLISLIDSGNAQDVEKHISKSKHST